jgi:Icc-related predicted phosphoesterase
MERHLVRSVALRNLETGRHWRSRTRARMAGAMCIALALATSGCQPYRAPSFADGPPPGPPDERFAVIGDLQSTMNIEAWRENNDPERRRLVERITDNPPPAFVVMAGDLVSWGGSADRWEEFDFNSRALREKKVPVLAVPGNHDYWGDRDLRHYFAHFDGLKRQRWYDRRYGSLALVFLDSNAGELDPCVWDEQRKWYEERLDALEKDETVGAVLVFFHHAPFTNSSVVGDDANTLSTFVPPFLTKKKTLAMITGHAHGYERFEKHGKAFIVTAGGGGPRSPLLPPEERRHPDDMFHGPRLRHLHFVEFTITVNGLEANVIALPKGEIEVCRMETFTLAWPEGRAPVEVSSPKRRSRPHLKDCCPVQSDIDNRACSEQKGRPAGGK